MSLYVGDENPRTLGGLSKAIAVPGAPFKYSEAEILQELAEYVASTYGQHYVGSDNVQAMDLIVSAGHGRGFVIGDIIKYAARQGKKPGQERKDILKILHYGMFLLWIHDKEQRETKYK